jgi:GDPmannose 4,6-dehydratase
MHRKYLKRVSIRTEVVLSDIIKVTNLIGICFVVNAEGKLVGVITDGDVRRAPLRGYDLDATADLIMNTNFFYALQGTPEQEILSGIPREIECIPVVDHDKKLIGYYFSSELHKKVALISGITGQDGAYLAKCLLNKGYRVYGGYRRTSNLNFERLAYLNILDKIELLPLDVTDQGSVLSALKKSNATEVYNLAAQSFVEVSFNQPCLTIDANTTGTVNFLEAIRYNSPSTRFYQASTSEMFGNATPPQDENTRFQPRSPYAVSKLAAHWMTVNYRESYGLFACAGILFNHESPIRGEEFVTRKITRGAARIKAGLEKEVRLGNLKAKRDWGYAEDYVECMYLMLQQDEPDDYVIATGVSRSVEEFADMAFRYIDLDYREYVKTDLKYIRPSDVEMLQGNPAKAKARLGWNSQKTRFEDLVKMMVEADMKRLGLSI